MKSVQDKLEKVRKPRVHITYNIETEGGSVKKELPFVVGVMSDLSGNAGSEKKPLRERSFVQIDPDNFNEVLNRISPGLDLKVPNTLKDDGSEIAVSLKFKSIEDFEPANVAQQVEPLKKLIEARTMLNELLSKADRSAELEAVLERMLQNNDDLAQVAKALGINQTPTGE